MFSPPIFCGLAMSTESPDAHPVRPHGFGDSCHSLKHLRRQKARGVVDIVQIAAVDADRSQQARVFGDRREVIAYVPVVKEDAAASVPALDGAVGIVPLIDPANGHGGMLAQVGVAHVGALSEIAQKCKDPIEHTAIAAADDVDLAHQVPVFDGDDKLLGLQGKRRTFGFARKHLLGSAEENHVRTVFERSPAGER